MQKFSSKYIVEDENLAGLCEVLKLMSDQENCFVFEETSDAVVKQVAPDVSINGRQWIIK